MKNNNECCWIVWNSKNQPTGLYFIKVNYNQEVKTEKIMLVK